MNKGLRKFLDVVNIPFEGIGIIFYKDAKHALKTLKNFPEWRRNTRIVRFYIFILSHKIYEQKRRQKRSEGT